MQLALQCIDDRPLTADEAVGWLGVQERARLERIRHPARRAQFLAGHALARELLVRRLGGKPGDWDLRADARGKPQVYKLGQRMPVRLSLSHSGRWVACVLATVEVGVDVQALKTRQDPMNLARSLYPASQLRQLEDASATERQQLFCRRWALDEARAKATGTGLRRQEIRRREWFEAGPEKATAWSWRLPFGVLAVAVLKPGQNEPVLRAPPADIEPARAWRSWSAAACQPSG